MIGVYRTTDLPAHSYKVDLFYVYLVLNLFCPSIPVTYIMKFIEVFILFHDMLEKLSLRVKLITGHFKLESLSKTSRGCPKMP